MRPFGRAVVPLALCAVLLAGCWDNNELPSWGFVQAVALDEGQDGQIHLTTQIYRPGSSEAHNGMAQKGQSFITLSASALTFSKASLKIADKLGRQLQWSHMRAVLLGDKLAQSRSIAQLVDFFARSQGPRGSVDVFVAQGEAARYLTIDPLIENTIGEQIRTAEQMASTSAGIGPSLTLLNLNIMSLTPGARVLVPHIRLISGEQEAIGVDGLAILRFPQGKTDAEVVPPQHAVWFTVLLGEYKHGQLTVPCQAGAAAAETAAVESGGGGANAAKYESFWVSAAQAKVDVQNRGGRPFIGIRLRLAGSLGEMTCSDVTTREGTALFLKKLTDQVKRQAEEAVAYAQRRHADVLGAGQHVYRHHPRLWRSWSQNWDRLFAAAEVSVSVRVDLTDSGMTAGQPLSRAD